MGKKIAVLGSNGQLGSDLVKVLEGEVIPITRTQFEVGRDEVDTLPADVDYIINCISYHRVDEAEELPEKAFEINTSFVYRLARFCRENGITLFHISTDYVFDGCKKSPYNEQDSPNPLNIYGLSKYSGELAIQRYMDQFFIFRVSSLFGVAGSSGKGGNFIETMLKFAQEGKKLKVVDDQYMSPTSTLDVARAINFFIREEVDEYGIYHCCNTGSCSWHQFTEEIFKRVGIERPVGRVSHREFKRKADRPKYSVMDNRKLEKYYRMPHWKEALNEYLTLKGYLK